MRPNDQNLMRKWANDHGKCDRQRIVRQETTKFKAVTLPLNMYDSMRLLSMEESDLILRRMKTVKCQKMMKEKMDLHLEFLK